MAQAQHAKVVRLVSHSERTAAPDTTLEARMAARAMGLRYVTDTGPGLQRVRKRGKNKFGYLDTRGAKLVHAATLDRVRMLAIPPAWTDVWICPLERGHIQATGRDARGRKQYRYHADWTKARDAAKHARMCDFAAGLTAVRTRCQELLAQRGLGREKVLAALVSVVDLTSIRVGHEEYAKANKSYGLTTLRNRHVRVRGAKVQLCFRGKSGILRQLAFEDRAIASVFAKCRALGGVHLFKFRDAQGQLRRVTADHVNAFLRELMGEDHSIKDFRTWSATVCVAVELSQAQPANTQRALKQQLLAAIRIAAEQLGNTPAICRKSYVHPLVMEAYAQGRVLPTPRALGQTEGYRAHEASVRRFLLSLARTRTRTRKAS